MAAAISFGEYEPEESPHEEDHGKVDYTFGIFIDGTLNNLYNTEARQAYQRVNSSMSRASKDDEDKASHYQTGGSIFDLFRDKPAEQTEYEKWLAGKPYDKDLAAKYKPKEDSYENDLSNPAILYKYYDDKKEKRRHAIYTDGIGTIKYGADDEIGYATGAGKVPAENANKPDTGIIGKVRDAIEQLAQILGKTKGDKAIGKITIDVFGFSRGAAAVRHLVHDIMMEGYPPRGKAGAYRDAQDYPVKKDQVKNGYLPKHGYLGLLLQDNGIELDSIIPRFAGLFDTVAHYTPIKGESLLSKAWSALVQNDDVTQLGLNSISKAKTVIHFTAANEHRYNFDLDTIRSVGGTVDSNDMFLSPTIPISRGLEKQLPGVHCDIGGSYVEGAPEVKSNLYYNINEYKVKARAKLLIEEGWFTDKELYISPEDGSFLLRSYRKSISNQYSFIPLHFMCELAITQQSVAFKDKQLLDDYKFRPSKAHDHNVEFLKTVKSILRKYVFENGPPLEVKLVANGTPISPAIVKTNITLKELRHHHLHWTASWGGFFNAHKPANDERKRNVWPG